MQEQNTSYSWLCLPRMVVMVGIRGKSITTSESSGQRHPLLPETGKPHAGETRRIGGFEPKIHWRSRTLRKDHLSRRAGANRRCRQSGVERFFQGDAALKRDSENQRVRFVVPCPSEAA